MEKDHELEALRAKPLDRQMEYFATERAAIERLTNELQSRSGLYKAYLKNIFGVTDGENVDILQLVQLIRTTSEANASLKLVGKGLKDVGKGKR